MASAEIGPVACCALCPKIGGRYPMLIDDRKVRIRRLAVLEFLHCRIISGESNLRKAGTPMGNTKIRRIWQFPENRGVGGTRDPRFGIPHFGGSSPPRPNNYRFTGPFSARNRSPSVPHHSGIFPKRVRFIWDSHIVGKERVLSWKCHFPGVKFVLTFR